MIKSLKFSHKILLAASLVVFAAFALFTLYNAQRDPRGPRKLPAGNG